MAPQITVPLDDETYMDLTHTLPKGLKSKFVTRAVAKAVMQCGGLGQVMHAYARHGEHKAHDVYNALLAKIHPNQTKLGVEEE